MSIVSENIFETSGYGDAKQPAGAPTLNQDL